MVKLIDWMIAAVETGVQDTGMAGDLAVVVPVAVATLTPVH